MLRFTSIYNKNIGIFKSVFSILFLFFSPLSMSQEFVQSEIAKIVPEEVIEAIKNNDEVISVFTIGQNEIFKEDVIKANEIVFLDSSTLTFNNIDAPWIIMIADKIKFQNPNNISKIQFASTQIETPPQTGKGARGADGQGRKGRHGRSGIQGQPGETGIKGNTKKLPHLYIITKELTSPRGTPAFAPLAILGKGFNGGRGGQGGNGGNGGNGVKGQDASSGLVDCRRGGGDGGDGGKGGLGGKGGDGGDGGDGLSITIVSTAESNSAFSYAQLFNPGGIGGAGGSPGDPGSGGSAGGMGGGTGHCSGGSSGSSGSIPNPPNLGYGSEGIEGSKGKFILINATDLDSIF